MAILSRLRKWRSVDDHGAYRWVVAELRVLMAAAVVCLGMAFVRHDAVLLVVGAVVMACASNAHDLTEARERNR